MNSILMRTLCGVAAVALLFSGLIFALDKRQKHGLAVEAHDQAVKQVVSQRHADETAKHVAALLTHAQDTLLRLEPMPGTWTTYPLLVKADMDAARASHLLRLLGKTDAWSFLRVQSLTLSSTCGVEPCATFHVDLQATAFAPVDNSEEFHGPDLH
jgi:hypothetical protein